MLVLAFFIINLNSFQVKATDSFLDWKYANTASISNVKQMLTDTAGNLYLAGEFNTEEFTYQKSSVLGTKGKDATNVFVFKVNPSGKLIWIKSIIGKESDSHVELNQIAINNLGELAISVTSENASALKISGNDTKKSRLTIYQKPVTVVCDTTYKNAIVAKISSSGYTHFFKTIQISKSKRPHISINDMIHDDDGSVFIGGHFVASNLTIDRESVAGSGSDLMMFMARINTKGGVDWLKNCNYKTSRSTRGNIMVNTLANTEKDYFYLGGNYSGDRVYYMNKQELFVHDYSNSFFALASKKSGDIQWVRTITGDQFDHTEKIVADRNGNAIIMSLTNSTAFPTTQIKRDFIKDPIKNIIQVEDIKELKGKFNIKLTLYTSKGLEVSTNMLKTGRPTIDQDANNAYIGLDHNGDAIVATEFYGSKLFSKYLDTRLLVNADSGTSDIMLAKLAYKSLEPEWNWHGTAPGDNPLEKVHIDAFGNTLISGTSYNELTLKDRTITSTTEGTPYIIRIKGDGNKDYEFTRLNETASKMYIDAISSDIYGNTYVAGNFSGNTITLSETRTLSSKEGSGVYIGKYAWVREVEGHVYTPDKKPITQGYVKIYGYTYLQKSSLSDSIKLDSAGKYTITGIPSGKYLVYAVPKGEFETKYIPTYYESAEHWENAVSIDIAPDNTLPPLDITLKNLKVFDKVGGGKASGFVYEIDSNDLKSTSSIFGRPSAKATVILAGNTKLKSTSEEGLEVISITETDENGEFAFYNVDDGNYILKVDIPGLPSEYYDITIDEGQFVSSLEFLVEEQKVSRADNKIIIDEQELEVDSTGSVDSTKITNRKVNVGLSSEYVQIFPNPTSSNINIRVDSRVNDGGTLYLYNLQGNLILTDEITSGRNSINLTTLSNGTYIIKITNSHNIVVNKISIIK